MAITQTLANPINKRQSGLARTWGLLMKNRAGMVGVIALGAFVFISFIGPLFVPPQTQADTTAINKGPSAAHWLGTDSQGHDNGVQLLYGGKDILIIAVTTGVLETALGFIVGALAAFIGGRFSSVLQTFTEVWLTIPKFVLLAILATLFKLNSVLLIAILIALLSWPSLALQVRTQILSLRERDYVQAAQMLNLGTSHIIFKEMLPNMMSFVMVSLISAMIDAVYYQVGLVFLGLIPFSSANWGVMFSIAFAKGAHFQINSAWSLLVPLAAIVLFQLALLSLQRALEEVFNPRLRTDA